MPRPAPLPSLRRTLIPFAGTGIIALDPWLEPFKGAIQNRFKHYEGIKREIEQGEGGYEKFSRGWEERGFRVDARQGVWYREWAPGAVGARLIGEFSEWPSERAR